MPDIDLDAIEAALVPRYDQYGRGPQKWHDSTEVRARMEWLPALVAEVERRRARDVLTTAVVEAARDVRAGRGNRGTQYLGAVDRLSAALDALDAGGA